MDTPLDHPCADTACRAGALTGDTRNRWLRALLRLFADMACRLR